MAELFYKITKAEADLLDRFEYAPYQAFDPYCSEQVDGSFIVSEEIQKLLKDHPKFKLINWAKTKITKEDVDAGLKDKGI